jgi:hypothetical protein
MTKYSSGKLMQITIDDIVNDPPHALTRRDVQALLKALPDEWNIWLKTVHLKATLPGNSRFVRPAIYSVLGGPRLNLCSRGLTPETARKEVLRELAIQAHLHRYRRRRNQLSQAELKEIDQMIEPLLKQADEQLQVAERAG